MSDIIKPKRFVKTVNGEEIEVPKVVFAKEKLIIDILKDAMKKVREDERLKSDISADEVYPLLLDYAPEVIVKIAATALGKSEEWVENNLDSEAIMEVVTPFFVKFSNLLTKKVVPLIREMGLSPSDQRTISTIASSFSSPLNSGGQQKKSSGSTPAGK